MKTNLSSLKSWPIGSIYISVNDTSPAFLFGGSWTALDGGKYMMVKDSAHAAGSIIAAGLPNITGSFKADPDHGWIRLSDGGNIDGITNAFAFDTTGNRATGGAAGSTVVENRAVFRASRSNSIYGNSSTVTPPHLCRQRLEKSGIKDPCWEVKSNED